MHVLCDCYDLDTLSYTFDHIWTNLLTQCTPVPVPIFWCFSISGFPHIKSDPKIRENQIKNQRTGSFRKHLGGAAPSGRLGTWWPPWLPPFAYIFSVTGFFQRQNPFSRSRLCSASIALPRSGASADLFPAPCRREDRP